MCIIIDANISHLVFCNTPSNDWIPILNFIENHSNSLAIGGKVASELFKHNRTRRIIGQYLRSGNARSYNSETLIHEENSIISDCVSDDPHVIALARNSGARLLCSHDQDLHCDFTNPSILNNPRGKIYQNSSHSHLLKDCKPCKSP